jgi:excisionase family DNA binding protein
MREKKRSIGIREAARKLSCSLKNIYDLVYAGKLPAEKVARQWRIPIEAIEARLKQRGE